MNRVPAIPKKTIRKNKWLSRLTSMSLSKLRSTECCKKLRCFRHVDYDHFLERSRFTLTASTSTRRTILASYLLSDSTFQFNSRRVCVKFLKKSFRFSTELVSAVRNKRPISRRRSYSLTSTGESRSTVSSGLSTNEANSESSSIASIQKKKEAIASFILRVAEDCGDSMPNRTEVHLPFHQHQELYPVFAREFKLLYPGQSVVTQEYFRKVWRTQCPHVKVMKSCRFTICDTCDRIRTGLRERILEGNSTDDIKEQRREHLKFVYDERMYYQKKKDRARLNSANICSVILDGADQTAFGIPHKTTTPKSQRGHALKVKLVGLLEHKLEPQLLLYTMTQEHQTGANHIVEVLHRFINKKRSEGPLPKKLYIQLDNCSRENKNRYVLGYCEYLVAHSVFDSVEVGFLPVGHTHEDIDQAFSQTSSRLRVHDAITLSDMHHELRQAYKHNTHVEHLRRLANWSGLCDTENCLRKVDKATQWRYFEFTPNPDAVPAARGQPRSTVCSVKRKCNDEWQPLENSGSRSRTSLRNSFLRDCPNIINTPPLVISCPEGLAEVTKRFDSEEGRINNIDKMISLHELRDFVFRQRVDDFHWDTESCVELEFIRTSHNTNNDNDAAACRTPSKRANESDQRPRHSNPTSSDDAHDHESEDEIQVRHVKPRPLNSARDPQSSTPQTRRELQREAHQPGPQTLAPHAQAPQPQSSSPTSQPQPSAPAPQPRTKVNYTKGSFVIVRKAQTTRDTSAEKTQKFWVGKVLEVRKMKGAKFASTLWVHWYDKEESPNSNESTEYLKSRFSPCYCTPTEDPPSKKSKTSRSTKMANQTPWRDYIDTDSVEVAFDGLTKKRYIPLQAIKQLNQ